MSGRYGKTKRQFGTKPMSRCRELSLARSVIGKREKGDGEAETSADVPVAGPVQLEVEPEQMPSSTELDVRISYDCLHQDIMHNIVWQLMSCQLGISEG